MPSFNAREYKTNSGQSHPVLFDVQPGCVVIQNGKKQIPFDSLTVEISGHDEDRIKIRCIEAGITLISTDKGVLEALTKADHTGVLATDLRRLTAKTKAQPILKNTYWLRVGSVCLVLLISGWIVLNGLLDLAADKVDPAFESNIGRSFLKGHKYDSTSPAAQRVQAVGKRLLAHLGKTPYKFQFYVTKDDTINAFAIPGGIIVVNSGLIRRAATDDELAGVIGHEMGHVVHRDTVRQTLHTAGLLACIGIVSGFGGENAGKIADSLMLARALEGQSFGRGQEARADITGVDLAVKSGYRGDGMIVLFRKMQKELPSADNKMLALLSNHPMTQDRIVAIQAELSKIGNAQKLLSAESESRSENVSSPAEKHGLVHKHSGVQR